MHLFSSVFTRDKWSCASLSVHLNSVVIETDGCEPIAAGPEAWPLHSVGVSRVEVPESLSRAGHGGNGIKVVVVDIFLFCKNDSTK